MQARSCARSGPLTPAARPAGPGQTPSQREPVYRRAALANLLNPKAASIQLTLVPQFVDPAGPVGGQILALATAHALLMTVWLFGWALLLRRASHLVARPGCRTAAARVGSVVLLALGLRAVAA
ncbi:LysE family translocator [Kitasatospora camelliae]|uniref:LysE family transporter n=1 Tax=Kitasatospora camelliae TaxID=3156397 RepID=A0AAU8K4M6_9ACTN